MHVIPWKASTELRQINSMATLLDYSRYEHGTVVLRSHLRMVVPEFLQYVVHIVVAGEAYQVLLSPRDSVDQHHTHTQVTIQLQAGR